MTLEKTMIKRKEEDGKEYILEVYELGGYTIDRLITKYQYGTTWEIFCFVAMENNYLPKIYFEDGCYGNDDAEFQIQTTAYGAMKPEEIKKIIVGYETALEVVEILTKEFLKGRG